jgi:hypothetical protein
MAVSVVDDCWPSELISDDATLFYRAHRQYLEKKTGRLLPHSFRRRFNGMSTDWDKYSTAAETLARSNIPDDNGIVVIAVANVRSIPDITVEHTPYCPPERARWNRAHCDVEAAGASEDEKNAIWTDRRIEMAKTAILLITPAHGPFV